MIQTSKEMLLKIKGHVSKPQILSALSRFRFNISKCYLVPFPLGVPVLPISPRGSCGLSPPEAISALKKIKEIIIEIYK
jgi:hypothetical protein